MRIGRKNDKTTYGVKEHVAGNGHFKTTYTFGAGAASYHRTYWFQIATLPGGNYPYSPSHSGRIYVKVGGHPKHHHAPSITGTAKTRPGLVLAAALGPLTATILEPGDQLWSVSLAPPSRRLSQSNSSRSPLRRPTASVSSANASTPARG